MAAGDPHPDAIAAAYDGQGAAAAARSGMQPSGQEVEGDGNQLLSQVSAGRDLTLGDSVAGDKIAGDKVDGDKVTGDKVSRDKIGRDKIEIVVADAQQAADVARSLRWSWPQPLDFGPYRSFRREGFVGRSWLFEEVRAWAIADGAAAGRPRAQLIEAEYGVGKSAFLAELVDTRAAGVPVVAQHFCQFDAIATLAPGRFVSSIAAQLAAALPAYRAAIEAEAAAGLRQLLEAPDNDPIGAFDQAVLAPLEAMAPPAGPLLLVVDALDEALEHRPSNDKAARVTIVSLLGQRAQRFPRWLRLLATARPLPAVQLPLRQAFVLTSLNAEEARNLADLETYAEARCQQPPLAALLAAAGLSASEVAIRLRTLSGGKFLYAAFVLNELAAEALPLRDRADLEALPAGMDDFYLQAFERRFPNEQAYDQVRELLALHSVQRDPLSRRELATILNWPEARLLDLQQQLHDLLRLRRNDPAYGPREFLASFNHPSLSRWLTATDEHTGYPRAGRFSIDPEAAEAAIHRWALAELEMQRAHTWPYLVRHLGSHLSQVERPALLAGLLGQFAWLEARLRLAGINALLEDFALADPAPWLGRLGRALGQGAHVLGHSEGWRGQEQLASQLLARLAEENDNPQPSRLRQEAADWLQQAGGAPPRITSLLAPEALLRTFPVGRAVTALLALPDGRLASGHGDNTIRLWDPASGACERVFEGHQGSVLALAVLGDGRLASGSLDKTIRLWDPASGACERVFEGHQGSVNALAVLGDGRLASGSDDNTIRLWDPVSGACERVFEGHQGPVWALAALGDGRLASGSSDNTIRLWDPASGACDRVFEGHQGPVWALAVLGDGRLASGSDDNTIRLWDPASGACERVFQRHKSSVIALAVLGDGRLASGSLDKTIRLWDPATGACERIFYGHQDWVRALAVLGDGRLASGSLDKTIRLWDPASGACEPVFEGHQGGVRALAMLGAGRLASGSGGSGDNTIRLWDPASGACERVFQGHQRPVWALAVLGDGRLASGSSDNTIRLWDPASGACERVFEGHQSPVNALAVLGDGRLASGSGDNTIRLWDPASGACERVFKGHLGWVNALAVLGDGRLASGSDDNTIRLWDPNQPDGAPRVLFVADTAITALVAHPTRPLLIAGDSSGRLHWLQLPEAL
jgi:WD40 repeat protein